MNPAVEVQQDARLPNRGGGDGASPSHGSMNLTPLTLPQANAMVATLHRHHAPIPAGFVWWCVGVVADRKLVGAAIAGRPTNRNNHDGQTVEALRVVSDGTPHVCSMLLGSCARAAKAIGAERIITYTLDHETGSSLRGAGWTREADNITSCWTKGTSRRHAIDRPHMNEPKVRWALHFANVPPITFASPIPPATAEPSLFDTA